jgi:hypothetical protein
VLFVSCTTALVNPAPGRGAVVIAVGRELVGTRRAFFKGFFAEV